MVSKRNKSQKYTLYDSIYVLKNRQNEAIFCLGMCVSV